MKKAKWNPNMIEPATKAAGKHTEVALKAAKNIAGENEPDKKDEWKPDFLMPAFSSATTKGTVPEIQQHHGNAQSLISSKTKYTGEGSISRDNQLSWITTHLHNAVDSAGEQRKKRMSTHKKNIAGHEEYINKNYLRYMSHRGSDPDQAVRDYMKPHQDAHKKATGEANEVYSNHIRNFSRTAAEGLRQHAKADNIVDAVRGLPKEIREHQHVRDEVAKHPGADKEIYGGKIKQAMAGLAKKARRTVLGGGAMRESAGAGEIGTNELTLTYLKDTPGQGVIAKRIAAIVKQGDKQQGRGRTQMVKRPKGSGMPNEINRTIRQKKHVFSRFHDVAEGAPNSVQKAESDVELGTVSKKKGKNVKDGEVVFASRETAAAEKREDERRTAHDGPIDY